MGTATRDSVAATPVTKASVAKIPRRRSKSSQGRSVQNRRSSLRICARLWPASSETWGRRHVLATAVEMVDATQTLVHVVATKATLAMHAKTSAQISALVRGDASLGSASACSVSLGSIAPSRRAAVVTEIAPFLALASAIRVGSGISAQWPWHVQIPAAVATALA